ncbi:hypothetical protein [Aliiglaciecola sp. M165]|uniref:hypothetical protein n=1 Tax=Aliiglaciecola sp. M165 TaxID=2593649 RepID=UPI00163DE4D8|nr:hypothetical protein [Aliiglaciecola sp. M165]
MRTLKPAGESGSQVIERRKNRRRAYFPGKYTKETIMFIVLFSAWLFYLLPG